MLRALWRGPLLTALLFGYLLAGTPSLLLPDTATRRAGQARRVRLFARLALLLLGMRVRPRGIPPSGGCLLAANHLSYLDILVWASLHPLLFVTSVEVGRDPLLGTLARWGGSVFVERRRPSGLKAEIARLSRLLFEGAAVMLFPEGTSTDGRRVLPFRAALMESALAARTPIQPACLKVTAVGKRPFGPETADRWCWHGRMRFLPHLLRVLATPSFEVSARFLPLLRPVEEPTRKDAAEAAHFFVALAYATDAGGGCAEERPVPAGCAAAGTGAA